MSHLTKAVLLVAALGLAACSSPGRIPDDGPTGPGVNGIDSSGLGSVSDPRSIAYFNQLVGDRVLFAVDESTISPEARATLVQQASWLLENTEYSAIIEGHADEQGTREYNLALGARRASAVQQFLIAQGVAASRLRTVTFGKERPLEICSNETCYAQNRRAVTVLRVDTGV